MDGECQLQKDIKKLYSIDKDCKPTLSLGQVDFVNCLPINLPIKLEKIHINAKIVNAIPSKLNKMILNSEIDIAPISSYAYLENKDKLTPIANLCIASNDSADSVLLFSKLSIEKLQDVDIALSHASATSNILLEIILKKFYKSNNRFHPLASYISLIDSNYTAALLIGDYALREANKAAKNIFVYDLGTLWKTYTGLPMVFGMWVVRNEVIEKYPEEIKIVSNQLRQAKEIGLTNMFNTVIKTAQEKVPISEDFYKSYFNHLSYELTDECKEGLMLFEKSFKDIRAYCELTAR